MQNCKITLTVASGIEAVLKRELFKLGYDAPPALNGSLSLQGNLFDVARLNMFLRTADRVYITLTEFPCDTFDGLFDGIYSFPWQDFLDKDAKIIVNGKSHKSKLFALSACQSVIKKAIVKKLSSYYNLSTLSESGTTYNLEFSIYKDVCSIHLNTSGQALHKRGYRTLLGQAPMRETLASAILLLSDFSAEKPLIDPFCGSGTIITEGARIALNIASGINRRFDYQKFPWFDKEIYEKVYEEAKDGEKRNLKLDFVGSDIDEKAIELCKKHQAKAYLDGKVTFKVMDVKDLTSDKTGGVIVTNPPYGERLAEGKQALYLYKTLGRVYEKLDNWSAFVITSSNQFEKSFGKRADKNRKLYNSNKECHLYEYFSKKQGVKNGR